MLKREIAIMKKLDHKHVVNLIEVIEDQKAQEIFLSELGRLVSGYECRQRLGSVAAEYSIPSVTDLLTRVHDSHGVHLWRRVNA